MFNARLYGFWGSLTEALRTGEPQNEAKQGGDLFANLYTEPARLSLSGQRRGRGWNAGASVVKVALRQDDGQGRRSAECSRASDVADDRKSEHAK